MQAAAEHKSDSNTRRRYGSRMAAQAGAVVLPRLKFVEPVDVQAPLSG